MSSADKLTIETPEQTLLEFPLAGIGSRFLAMLADTAVQFLIAAVGLIVGVLAVPGLRWFGLAGTQWAIAAMVVGAFVVNSGYFAFFEAIWNGQTPGKRFAHIRVIKDDGRPISAYDAVARNLLRIVDEMPGLYTVGMLSVLFSKQNKRLGDYVAGTVVVHERLLEDVRLYRDTRHAANTPGVSAAIPPVAVSAGTVYDTARLGASELQLMETFLGRSESLDPAVRASMARQIAQRIAEKLGAQAQGVPPEFRDDEEFLNAVLERVRSSSRFR